MKKKLLILLLASYSLIAQPSGPGDRCNPACYTPNPPFWCDCNPVPIDTYHYLLLLSGLLLGVYFINKKSKNKTLLQ
jgi:hypothetical protein